ncbi:NAD-dependent epimerase/dehydratase family protein [Ruania halotolerans]|uniref:NAD-dependent epimerase/dehydratase family protein n=1 Tax=Ruania halotolerans TaxID=2897773 RepID=UPI001E2CB548|nr:NAD-dependent epimerase/dehydratase family protein [Ruania halotolerans]UFU06474.1 NAD-dependent epimerase/dehydratase family protein [Ruania halotolerans]
MRTVILGGTGAFASRVTQACLERGDEVMVLTRGQRQLAERAADADRLTFLRADRQNLQAYEGELKAFAPEAVMDAICFTPAHARQLVDLFGAARRVVMISSVDVYGADIGAAPVSETRPPAPASDYAAGKAEAERTVLDGLGPRATVIRPSHMLGRGYGTAGLWGRTEHVVARLRAGLPIALIDGGRGVTTPVHAVDVAAWVLATMDNPAADGEVFNAVGAQITTQWHYFATIADLLGVPLRTVSVPGAVIAQAGIANPFRFHRPYSCAKAVRVLGHEPSATLASMLAETIQAMPHVLGAPQTPPELTAASLAEDRIVEMADRHTEDLLSALTRLR